jgi:flavin-dependent dehydrogenase
MGAALAYPRSMPEGRGAVSGFRCAAMDATRLQDGGRVAVIGGGPAGSFFTYFLLQMADRVGRKLEVDRYEPRDFTQPGPRGCNMCGGIVSESLVQRLVAEGIELPPSVVQRHIDSYSLHMDVGSVRIDTPLREMRIAAVARGAGPRTAAAPQESFDAYLLDLARRSGARQVRDRVTGLGTSGGRPCLRTAGGREERYDLAVGACGVNSALLGTLEGLHGYRPPRRTKAFIAEFPLGRAMTERYLGNSMHVFLLDLEGVDFAALIPKSDFVTVCMLGREIDRAVADRFLSTPVVQECLPPHWRVPRDFCRCSPRLNIAPAIRPCGDRVVFIGDCGTTRLFKDGIGAAYRTAKAAARTAIFRGVSAADFEKGFLPTCRAIDADNRLGKVVFLITRQVQRHEAARRGLWRMTSREQMLRGDRRRMSAVLWDTFTGSEPYRSIFLRSLHPAFLGRFTWEIVAGMRHGDIVKPREKFPMASGETGLLGRKYREGQVVYQQGDRGDCMYVIQAGSVEMIRREGDREFCIAVLEKGDLFGETALFQEETRRFTARALEESTIFTMERNGLLERIHEDPSMAFRLLQKMSVRVRNLEEALIRHAPAPV